MLSIWGHDAERCDLDCPSSQATVDKREGEYVQHRAATTVYGATINGKYVIVLRIVWSGVALYPGILVGLLHWRLGQSLYSRGCL